MALTVLLVMVEVQVFKVQVKIVVAMFVHLALLVEVAQGVAEAPLMVSVVPV
jgi:hypothetical protein